LLGCVKRDTASRKSPRRSMSVQQGLSVDIRGVWSPVQARKVLEIIQPEAWALGLEVVIIDVTAFGDTVPRLLLVTQCKLHHLPVVEDHACEYCHKNCAIDW